jgi:hypothetical protein
MHARKDSASHRVFVSLCFSHPRVQDVRQGIHRWKRSTPRKWLLVEPPSRCRHAALDADYIALDRGFLRAERKRGERERGAAVGGLTSTPFASSSLYSTPCWSGRCRSGINSLGSSPPPQAPHHPVLETSPIPVLTSSPPFPLTRSPRDPVLPPERPGTATNRADTGPSLLPSATRPACQKTHLCQAWLQPLANLEEGLGLKGDRRDSGSSPETSGPDLAAFGFRLN